jgi:hypothetical protein
LFFGNGEVSGDKSRFSGGTSFYLRSGNSGNKSAEFLRYYVRSFLRERLLGEHFVNCRSCSNGTTVTECFYSTFDDEG